MCVFVLHVCMYVCRYVMYVCMHAWMYVCVHVCMYVCMSCKGYHIQNIVHHLANQVCWQVLDLVLAVTRTCAYFSAIGCSHGYMHIVCTTIFLWSVCVCSYCLEVLKTWSQALGELHQHLNLILWWQNIMIQLPFASQCLCKTMLFCWLEVVLTPPTNITCTLLLCHSPLRKCWRPWNLSKHRHGSPCMRDYMFQGRLGCASFAKLSFGRRVHLQRF